MNYYEHHLGDYDADTAHLSWLEDMAYTRLMRLYYRKEAPIPADLAQACRLVRADTEEQRIAVCTVLEEFFERTTVGWINRRCEREIAAYQERKKNHWASALTRPQRTAMENERRAAKVNATPGWLTQADRREIASIYERAALLTAATGERHEVDHVVPLRSSVVCGLHVPWNLEVIKAYKNRAKSNRFKVA